MQRSFRAYLGVFLALMLAFTGQSMAVARGMPGPAGEIILCTGAGIVSVAVDENGQPVERPHICPDCALSLIAYASDAPQLPARPRDRAYKLAPPGASAAASAHRIEPAARGPPVA